jgi:hypothetical protein
MPNHHFFLTLSAGDVSENLRFPARGSLELEMTLFAWDWSKTASLR